MSEQIPVEKRVFGKDFSKVIDTQFRQLLGQNENIVGEVSIDDFFQLYEELFYAIPKEGDINSHRYILQREAEYLDVKLADEVDVQELLNEITTLRNELLLANKVLNENQINIVDL
jgi:hypothetical protein